MKQIPFSAQFKQETIIGPDHTGTDSFMAKIGYQYDDWGQITHVTYPECIQSESYMEEYSLKCGVLIPFLVGMYH